MEPREITNQTSASGLTASTKRMKIKKPKQSFDGWIEEKIDSMSDKRKESYSIMEFSLRDKIRLAMMFDLLRHAVDSGQITLPND